MALGQIVLHEAKTACKSRNYQKLCYQCRTVWITDHIASDTKQIFLRLFQHYSKQQVTLVIGYFIGIEPTSTLTKAICYHRV